MLAAVSQRISRGRPGTRDRSWHGSTSRGAAERAALMATVRTLPVRAPRGGLARHTGSLKVVDGVAAMLAHHRAARLREDPEQNLG
jgi:hypothetical protein